MITQMNPYLTFDGNCREAMTFYQRCFGGELSLQTVAETPMAAQCPTGMQEQIIHASLTGDTFVLMGTDMLGPEGFRPGNTMAVSINFNKEEKIKEDYAALAEGGTIIDPLKEAFWGGLFAVVQDRYGKVWMLNYQK